MSCSGCGSVNRGVVCPWSLQCGIFGDDKSGGGSKAKQDCIFNTLQTRRVQREENKYKVMVVDASSGQNFQQWDIKKKVTKNKQRFQHFCPSLRQLKYKRGTRRILYSKKVMAFHIFYITHPPIKRVHLNAHAYQLLSKPIHSLLPVHSFLLVKKYS